MPRFEPDQVSEAELEELIEFIGGLEPAEVHQEPVDLSDEEVIAMHHWLAIFSIKADRIDEARHHLTHIIDLVQDEEHRRQMIEVDEFLNTGKTHDAEHAIENMLAGTAEPALSFKELHLQMALSALAVHDAEDALHHLHHYMDAARPEEKTLAQEATGRLEDGQLYRAEELIIQLLEGMPHHQHHQHHHP
jgi:hypothetical protein